MSIPFHVNIPLPQRILLLENCMLNALFYNPEIMFPQSGNYCNKIFYTSLVCVPSSEFVKRRKIINKIWKNLNFFNQKYLFGISESH